MEARIARLESDVAHLRTDVAEIKVDVRALRDKMDGLKDNPPARSSGSARQTRRELTEDLVPHVCQGD